MVDKHDQEAREAMARAIYPDMLSQEDCDKLKAEGRITEYLDKGTSRHAMMQMVDDILAVDPLRKALGPRAVEAILKGEAGVYPVQRDEERNVCPIYGKAIIEESDKKVFYMVDRLDTPGEAA